MDYTVHQLARLAGISPRTLRYYDQIDLLPAPKNRSGYRIYGRDEVARLQQILFYRELGMPLERIREMMTAASFDGLKALKEHQERLLAKKTQLDALIANVKKTIAMTEGEADMSDPERFEGFKQQMIEENESKYGEEIRKRFGEEAIDRANKRFGKMRPEEWAEVEKLSKELYKVLGEAFQKGDPAGNLAQKACELHRQWLMHFWETYTPEAHMALAQIYVDDARFTAHYDDAVAPGCAAFLRDAVRVYTGIAG